jgi:hypothetical protein
VTHRFLRRGYFPNRRFTRLIRATPPASVQATEMSLLLLRNTLPTRISHPLNWFNSLICSEVFDATFPVEEWNECCIG